MTQTIHHHLFVETVEGVVVASLADAEIIDEGVIEEIREGLTSFLEGLGADDVVLSFREVRFMSSSMLAVLLRFARGVAGREGRLKLCEIAPHLMEIFRITRFDRLFDIHGREADALDAFHADSIRP